MVSGSASGDWGLCFGVQAEGSQLSLLVGDLLVQYVERIQRQGG